MRLYPAGWLMTRKALRDDRLGEYFVPAGTEIYVSPYFIHRHPRIWKDPDRFNPDRFGADRFGDRHRLAMIPFSAGPRNCVGALFARVEMQIHLLMVAKHMRLRYVPSRPLELDAGVNLRTNMISSCTQRPRKWETASRCHVHALRDRAGETQPLRRFGNDSPCQVCELRECP